MIRSFADALSADLFQDRLTNATRRFPFDLRRVAQRKLQYLNAASKLEDLSSPPGNRLEALRGNLKGFIQFVSTINGEFYFGGNQKEPLTFILTIIIRS